MIRRCNNPAADNFKYYGGRGIRVAAAWTGRAGFWAFAEYVAAALGDRPTGCTLDRVNVERGYEPGNLRWADRSTQMGNQRRSVRVEVGDRFDRLVVVELTRQPKPGVAIGELTARCMCDCGAEIVTRRENLPKGRSRSCGCRQREAAANTMAQVNARKRAAAGLPVAAAPVLTRSRGGDLSGQQFLTVAGVAALLGVDPQTVRGYRVRSKPGGIYARNPFPEPDDTIGRNAVWHPDRAEEIRSWSNARVGRGNGGGRLGGPRTAEEMAQKEARAKGGVLQVCAVFAGRRESIDTYATYTDPARLPGNLR